MSIPAVLIILGTRDALVIPGIVFTPNGDEKTDLDSSDGSGIAHPLQSRFENHSLVDAKVGQNKKSIMMDVDPYYGRPTLLK